MQEDNRSPLNRARDILGEVEDLVWELSKAEKDVKAEVQRLTTLLATKANEVDQLKREGAHTVREELERLKAELASEKLRHAESIRAARAENDKLREAKEKAFRQLADQRLVAKAVEQYREANLKLLRERDTARSELAGWRANTEELARDRANLQSELMAQGQENGPEARRKQALLDAAPRMLEALLEVEAGRRGDYTNYDGDHILVCLGGKEINVSELVRTARGGA